MESTHWQPFLEFSSYELWSGGPDPHLSLATQGMYEVIDNPPEAAWRAGCYMSPYVISTGAFIWENWSLKEVLAKPENFTSWVEETWPGWQIRRERRAARTPKKMALSMLSYANWATMIGKLFNQNYETIWNSADEFLLYYGRYANIKILEALFRAGLIREGMPDIRPKDAWSPRKTLAWLFTEDEQTIVNAKNSDKNGLELINRRVNELRDAVSQFVGYQVSNFQIEVLLCNYRQVLDTRNGRYPGWSQDADLMYHQKIIEKFGDLQFDFYGHRKNLFPPEILGEKQGWTEPRKELCGYKGYFWCDALYDYHKTTDYNKPVERIVSIW